mgnify:CR=1 FL=1
MANITALAVARHVKLQDRTKKAVLYCSDQTHSSINLGLWLLGFRDDQLGVVTFRFAPPGLALAQLNQLNGNLVEAMIADSFAMIRSTLLRGTTVLRMCTINPRTTDADVEETLRRLHWMGEILVPGS